MNVNFNIVNPNNNISPMFGSRGKPLSLDYIIQKRAYILPNRVLEKAGEIYMLGNPRKVSLLDIHKSLYAPLLDCKSLEEVKFLYHEFAGINDVEISYRKNSIDDAKKVYDVKKDFALNVIKEYWANLKTKDEIAQMFGMKGRNTLEWALQKIGFVTYSPNYKTILNSSDKEGNKIIADKTKEWLAKNPEYMYEHNKMAAQGCKTEEYRQAQSKRMVKYDIKNPQRRAKIKDFSQRMWDKCTELKTALSDFTEEYIATSENGSWLKSILKKRAEKIRLTDEEKRILRAYYKEFWEKYPEYKNDLKSAAEEVRRENSLDISI